MTVNAKTLKNLVDRIVWLEEALRLAAPHVYRQQHAGKHKQDREDAVEWITKYGDHPPG